MIDFLTGIAVVVFVILAFDDAYVNHIAYKISTGEIICDTTGGEYKCVEQAK